MPNYSRNESGGTNRVPQWGGGQERLLYDPGFESLLAEGAENGEDNKHNYNNKWDGEPKKKKKQSKNKPIFLTMCFTALQGSISCVVVV